MEQESTSDQIQTPKPGEPGSRENPVVVARKQGDYYGGYAGDRHPALDPRVVGRPADSAVMQAAAEKVAPPPTQPVEEAK